ncbi:MAG: SAM-dependent methyltransferase [Actinobacteria bacterium]|nr:SAM-dependent methyltransferase [Actinomycetota bacterium]
MRPGQPGAEADPPAELDTGTAHPARVYNYWLGGKDNFAADREAAQQVIGAFPGIVAGVREQRAFLGRAVRYLAGEAGVRQFLDIGTGLPSAGNTHEVAQAVAPESRVVYVDNDPIVLAHARALLASSPEGATSYLDADLRHTETILRKAAATLDFGQPVAIILLGVLQLIGGADDPYQIVAVLMDAAPPGSYLVIGHPASDIDPAAVRAAAGYSQRVAPMTPRSRAEVARFFTGLELVRPGLVQLPEWRPEPGPRPDGPVAMWCGVARKR